MLAQGDTYNKKCSPWKQNLVMNWPFWFHASRELATPLMSLDSELERVSKNALDSNKSLILTMKSKRPS